MTRTSDTADTSTPGTAGMSGAPRALGSAPGETSGGASGTPGAASAAGASAPQGQTPGTNRDGGDAGGDGNMAGAMSFLRALALGGENEQKPDQALFQ